MAVTNPAAQTLTTADEVLKEHYLDVFNKAFNTSTVLLSRLKRKTATVSGQKYIFSLHTARNQGVGFRPETDPDSTLYLPPPGYQTLKQAYLTRAHLHGAFKITGAAMSAAARNGSLVELLGTEMRGLKDDMSRRLNRQLYGTGTGAIAQVTATGGATSATVPVLDSSRLEAGMLIQLGGSDGTSSVTGTILTVDSRTQITLSASVTFASSDYIYPGGTIYDGAYTTAAEYGNACNGLGNIVSDGTEPSSSLTYAGLTHGTNTFIDAQCINGAAGLSTDLMFQALEQMERTGNGKCSLIITSQYQWRKYGNLATGGLTAGRNRYWMNNIKRLDFGFQFLDFNGIPLVYDVDCDADSMYFLDERDWALLLEEDLHMVDWGGSVLRWIGGGAQAEDAVEARSVWRGQLACYNPKRQAKIYNLAV